MIIISSWQMFPFMCVLVRARLLFQKTLKNSGLNKIELYFLSM